jgi:hypothetical protein
VLSSGKTPNECERGQYYSVGKKRSRKVNGKGKRDVGSYVERRDRKEQDKYRDKAKRYHTAFR